MTRVSGPQRLPRKRSRCHTSAEAPATGSGATPTAAEAWTIGGVGAEALLTRCGGWVFTFVGCVRWYRVGSRTRGTCLCLVCCGIQGTARQLCPFFSQPYPYCICFRFHFHFWWSLSTSLSLKSCQMPLWYVLVPRVLRCTRWPQLGNDILSFFKAWTFLHTVLCSVSVFFIIIFFTFLIQPFDKTSLLFILSKTVRHACLSSRQKPYGLFFLYTESLRHALLLYRLLCRDVL